MDDIKVFIANLGKYNEGEIVGAWFTPPINKEELAEKLGLNDQYEEYMVQDYEGPVVFSEYSTIGEINEAAAAVEALKGTEIYPAIKELIGEWYDNVIELAAHKDDIACYHVANMTELAEELADEGWFGDIPPQVENYIDYAKVGRDLEIEGGFVETPHGIYQLLD